MGGCDDPGRASCVVFLLAGTTPGGLGGESFFCRAPLGVLPGKGPDNVVSETFAGGPGGWLGSADIFCSQNSDRNKLGPRGTVLHKQTARLPR